METDSDSEKKSSNNKSHTGDILQSLRIRCGFCFSDKMDGFIRRHRRHFLFHLGLLFWIILPFEEK
jgi:hypothetical protein